MRCLTLILTSILILFSISTGAFGQVSPQAYEGQTVAEVDLVSAPSLDLHDEYPLVQQKAGDPYSQQKVEATIQAIQKTGRFSHVDVQVTPELAGLRVTFVLEPAYYYGVMEFPGSHKKFSYVRLLQVADLPDQEPYEAHRVEQAKTNLMEFFKKNGFFQAKVTTSTQLEKANGLADVVFHIDLGHRAEIGKVTLEGPPREESIRLLDTLRSIRALVKGGTIRQGKFYTPKRIDAANTLLKDRLADQGYLASKVEIRPPEYVPATNTTDLSIMVEQGPHVSIKIVGASLSWIPFLGDRNKHRLIPMYQERTFDQDLVQEGKRNLTDFFQSKGYFDVKVTTAVQRDQNDVSVVYDVQKGERHKVEAITFEGNRHLSDDQLESAVAVKPHHFLSRGKFSDKLVRQSAKNIEAVYTDNGFEEVSVSPQVVNKDANIQVTFQITEGPQTTVEAVNFQGTHNFTPQSLRPQGGYVLTEGAPYSPHKMSQDRGSILASYLDAGYLSASVNSTVDRDPQDAHKVIVTYKIKEGQEVKISKVAITGQKVTRRDYIARTAGLGPNTPFSQGKLLEAESGLYNLGLFNWASVGPRRPVTDQSAEEAVIKVHESRRNDITYGFGIEISKRGGNIPTGTVAVPGLPTVGLGGAQIQPSEETFVSPRGSVQYTRHNIRGLGETGAISLLAARLDQRVLATYSDPQFRGSSWSTLLSLSAERNTENPLFAARLENFSYQFERPITHSKTTTAQLRYSFGKTNLNQLLVPELVLPADRSVRLSTFSGTIIRDTRDKPLDSHRGFYETADFGITGSAIGASADFSRFLGQIANYHPMKKNLVWANSLRIGMAKAYSGSRVPTSERFFAGGGTTLRGFPVNGAGPQRVVPFCTNPLDQTTCVNVTIPVGGNELFIVNSELRFPIPVLISNLGGAVFYDGGNVFRTINFSDFTSNYSNTIGFGIRYNTPVGPVRFDIGHNLNPVPGFRSTQFFITLGQSF